MAYLSEMGPIEQNIAKQSMQSGQPLPDRIANAPELYQGLYLFLQAFFDLDSEREPPKPIPWTSVLTYAVFNKFDEEQTEDLIYFIRKIDAEHLKKLKQ